MQQFNQNLAAVDQQSSPTTKRYIYIVWLENTLGGATALIANFPEGISRSTIQRILKTYNLRKWKSKKRIPLTKELAEKRLIFCLEWASFDQWENIIFSDECSVERDSNSPVQFVFRFQDEAFRQDLLNLTSHGRGISQNGFGLECGLVAVRS